MKQQDKFGENKAVLLKKTGKLIKILPRLGLWG